MRGLGIILSGTLAAGVAWAGSAGYLPAVGPARLRFQPPQSVARVVLPPLQMQDPLPTPPQMPEAVTNQVAEPVPVVVTPQTLDLSAAPTNFLNRPLTNSPAPVPVPAPDDVSETDPVISPEVFLRFFTPAGAGPGSEVVVPLPPGFNPAQPRQPASSSATYNFPSP